MPEERLKQYSTLVEAGLERYLPLLSLFTASIFALGDCHNSLSTPGVCFPLFCSATLLTANALA